MQAAADPDSEVRFAHEPERVNRHVRVAVEDETGAGHLREQLRANYSQLVGFCIMLFALIASPCMATVAVTRRESGSWKWAAFQFFGLTMLAWIVTTVVYQVGTLIGLGI